MTRPHRPSQMGLIALRTIIEPEEDITMETEQMRIPDCLFVRNKDVEKEYGYLLAGFLIVRRRKDRGLTKKEQKAVGRIVSELSRTAANDPDLQLAVINLDGSQTDVGDKLGDDAWVEANYDLPVSEAIKIEVRVDPSSDLPEEGQLPEKALKEMRRKFSN